MDIRYLEFLKAHEKEIFGTKCEYCKPERDTFTGEPKTHNLTECVCPPYSTFDEWRDLVQEKNRKKIHYGLRITKPTNMTEEVFHSKLLKMPTKYKWFNKFHFNMEYWIEDKEQPFSKTAKYYPHSHLAIEDIDNKAYKKNNIISRVCKHFGLPPKSNMVQIWTQMNSTAHTNYVKYIKRLKPENKIYLVKKDLETITEYNLKDYYTDF